MKGSDWSRHVEDALLEATAEICSWGPPFATAGGELIISMISFEVGKDSTNTAFSLSGYDVNTGKEEDDSRS